MPNKALFIIPCSGRKRQNGDGPRFEGLRDNLSLPFLNSYRTTLVNYFTNLPPFMAGINRGILNAPTMPAIHRYDGNFYRQLDDEVKTQFIPNEESNVWILSGLFGLFYPRDLIPNYEVTMDDNGPNGRSISDYWSRIFSQQNTQTELQRAIAPFSTIYCFMGNKYCEVLQNPIHLLGRSAYKITCPGRGNAADHYRGKFLNDVLTRGLNELDELQNIQDDYHCIIESL
jgi:cytoplasmic iron level regulating protein YaaA (DUF328/UPF0246 family)